MKNGLKILTLTHFLAFLFVMNSNAAIDFPENNIGKKTKILETGNRVSNVFDPDQGGYERINADGGYIKFNNTKYGNTSAIGTGWGHFPTDNDDDTSTLQYVAMRIRLSAGVTNYSNLEIGLYVEAPNKNSNNHKNYTNWTSDGSTPLPALTSDWQWVVFKTTNVGRPTPWFRVWFTNAIGVIDVSDIYACEFQPVYPPPANNNNNNNITDITPIYIKNDNVGIGVTDPTVKLDVDGTIRANEVVISIGSGADFVFEENYNLMPLNEVHDFIWTNKHLPEIPSAADMIKSGLGMGEFQIKLLQKVEELTLYVIEQNKAIENLQRKNEELESKIRKLR